MRTRYLATLRGRRSTTESAEGGLAVHPAGQVKRVAALLKAGHLAGQAKQVAVPTKAGPTLRHLALDEYRAIHMSIARIVNSLSGLRRQTYLTA